MKKLGNALGCAVFSLSCLWMAGISEAALVPVQYIQATKAQCLQTDYVPKANTKIVFDLKMEGDIYQNTGCTVLFSVPDAIYNFQANFGGGATEGFTVYSWPWKMYGQGGNTTVESMQFSETVIKDRNTFSFGLGRCDWGNKGRTIHSNPTAAEHVFQSPLFVLGTNASTPFNGWDVVLYGFKIYEGDEVVREYVPAVKDGVAGFFETKGQTFRGSATETEFKYPDMVEAAFANVGLNDAAVVLKPVNALPLPATVRFVSGFKPDLSDGVEVELGTLTTAEAVTFPVAFSRSAKTYCRLVAEDRDGSVFPCSVQEVPVPSFNSLSYVTEGLVAQWDGADNAGRGAHADAPTVWKDLVGENDIPLPSWVSVIEKGLLSVGSSENVDPPVLQSIKGLEGDDVTIESAARLVCWKSATDVYAIQQLATSPWGIIGYQRNANTFCAMLPPAGTDVTKMTFCTAPTDVSLLEYQTLTSRATRNSATATNGLAISGVPVPVVYNTYAEECPDHWAFFVNSFSDLEISAIRVYNRRLTAYEVAENALVDRVRFAGDCDIAAAMTLHVEYDGEGASSRQGYGFWPILDEEIFCSTERFVPDTSWVAGNYTSTCLGWTLYVETGDDVWSEEASGTGCSMSYQNVGDRRRRLVWHTARSRELPGEYVRLECLEAHGQQMIDTGYSPNYQTVLRLDVSFEGSWISRIVREHPGHCLYGTPANADDLVFAAWFPETAANKLFFWTHKSTDWNGGVGVTPEILANRNCVLVSMAASTGEYSAGSRCSVTGRKATETQPETVRLCGATDPFDCFPTMRLYGSYIMDNTTLRRDFIPVRSTETGVRGLYDYVTGGFYTNMVENAADFTGAAEPGILVEGYPARLGEPTIPYGWSQVDAGAEFELAESNVAKHGRKRMHVKSIIRYIFDEMTHSWVLVGRTRGSKLTTTHAGVPTKYVLEWVSEGLAVIVR